MNRLALLGASAIALLALPEAVKASGDFRCTVSWKVSSPTLECASRAVLSPGNDTRINLALLLRDRAKVSSSGSRHYPATDYSTSGFGRVFLDWARLKASYWPSGDDEDPVPYAGSRCRSFAGGTTAFASALAAASELSETERGVLGAARRRLAGVCEALPDDRVWPTGIGSSIGRDFLTYLAGAEAFYAGRFDEARTAFALLLNSRDPWVRETAAYMVARNELVAAQEPAFDEWGFYLGAEKTDKEAARRGQAALASYLENWPDGRYAASARGLQRRALWLLGERGALANVYSAMLMSTPVDDPAIPTLIDEIDNKLDFATGAAGGFDTPLLLAILDLQRMRAEFALPDDDREVITAQEIAAQKAAFAQAPDLYTFVQANHAHYVAQDYRRVLELLPEETGRKNYTPLAFSRQMLRGLALEALGDPDTEGFWLRLIDGANDLFQRPLVELALAMHWERHGQLERVFAPDSPVRESEIHIILLQHAAGEALLRAQAQRTDRPRRERDVALFMLLYRQLGEGRYAGFVKDLALVPTDASRKGELGDWLDPQQGNAPVGLFTSGRWSQIYPCPALVSTAATLARDPSDPRGLLCLGEFYRLNGLDAFMSAQDRPNEDELGGAGKGLAGEVMPRQSLYHRVIADPRASGEDKAYALFRAVWC
ncbi:MAG: hypothetical protein N2423_05370, partial [Novosphingobium sp.]|nr:hypothetical protein [Novosphingobium sp.]